MLRRLAVAGWVLASACAPGTFSDFVGEETGEVRDAAVDARGAADAQVVADATVADATLPHDAGVSKDTGAEVLPDADAATDAGTTPTCPLSSSHVLSVSAPAVELARMAKSPRFGVRALGPIARWGETDHVWTFSNAFQYDGKAAPASAPGNHPFIAFDGDVQPWNRPVTKPWTLRTASADDALPPTMFPLTGGESNLMSIVPTSLTRAAGDTRTEAYALHYDYLTPTRVWRATIEDGSAAAVRREQPLFTTPPLFAIAARIETRSDGTWMHIYACTPDMGPSRCYAGRVPYDKRDDASAYQIRTLGADGKWAWTNDLQAGTPVLQNVAGVDLSVSFNSYLGRFVAVYGEWLSNDVYLRTSESPYGPWSDPPVVVQLPPAATWVNVNVREQPPLAQNCERRLVISYFAPTVAEAYPTDGDVVMAAIDLD